ncbi:hypothetical protein [Parafrankia discariae]|uniref:hypothetical protein n=1 Tax=Parafrankia discariae TaxID=365528 RepID=UPI00037D3865|nr:hypothetical protein [Parafrankia discariae]
MNPRQAVAGSDLALNLAREVANALDLACGLTRTLDLADALASASDLASSLANDLDSAFAGCLTNDLDSAHRIASRLASDLVNRFPLHLGLASDLLPSLERCRKSADRLVRSLEKPTSELASSPAPDRAIRSAPDRAIRSAPEPASRPPGRTVRAVTALACRLLSVDTRARYALEFHSELFELPRRYRLGHAIRILRTAPAIQAGIRAIPIAEREG